MIVVGVNRRVAPLIRRGRGDFDEISAFDDMRAENGGKQMKSVWRFLPPSKAEKAHGKHPTQKPVDLLRRCIAASTVQGDIVFDPFAGSSTTGVAALELGRKYWGCESEAEFIELSRKRLGLVTRA